ncbi:MAG TPA: DUF883 domain-containing protein [Caulobacteraceae bacterium]|nr:DUF883 domain-containing protein [Caulobacteraceae bacterium]
MAANDTTANDANTTNGSADEQQKLRDFALKAEQAARERAAQLREQAQTYYDDASVRLDEAQRYIVERVQEKPIQSTLIAVGAGVFLGLLLGGRRR